MSRWMNPNRKAQLMLVSDFHATFNACLHMHELFTAPCVQSEDVQSLNTRKIPRALARGGGRGVRVPSCQPWWRLMEAACYLTAALLLLAASPSYRRTEITAHRRHLLFVSFDSQGRDFHSAEVGSPKKKRKRKRNMASSVTELLPQPQLSDRQSHRSQPREKIIEFQFCCVKAGYL